jgi:hypothetical protein
MYRKLIAVLLLLILCFPVVMADSHYIWQVPTSMESATPDLFNVSVGTNATAIQVNPPGLATLQSSYYFRFTQNPDGFVDSTDLASIPTGQTGLYPVPSGGYYKGWGANGWTMPVNTSKKYISAIVQINNTNPGRIVASWYIGGFVTPTVFNISDSTDFATKLSGVIVTISNGQSGTTDANGMLSLYILPSSSTYTYSLVKTGYTTKSAQSLGGYGETGGTLYDTMDPDTGTLPAGYTRTTVYCTDGSTGTPIVGATLNIMDVQNSSWKNGTSSVTGTIIDVLASHTLDIYGSYPGVYTASQELDTAPGGNYYLPLYTYAAAPIGYVNLFIYLRESGTGTIIKNADVYAKWTESGVQKSDQVNTANSGTASFIVPNTTVIIYQSHAPGFIDKSESLTTGIVDRQVTMTLGRQMMTFATPTATVTDPSTGAVITAQPTYVTSACNPNSKDYDADQCSKDQDSNLMAQLRQYAPDIVTLAIVSVIFGLFGYIFSSMRKWGKG